MAKTTAVKRAAGTGPKIHLDRPEIPDQSVGKPPVAPARERENPADVKARQAAFDSTFSWNDEELFPFSSSREALFSQLRLSMGAPPILSCMADSDAFLADALRIIYLCCHEPKVFNKYRSSPLVLQTEIDKWSDANIPRNQYQLVTVIGLRIYAAAHVNQHEPAPLATKGHGDDAGN